MLGLKILLLAAIETHTLRRYGSILPLSSESLPAFLVTVIVYYSMSFSLFCSSYLISLPGTAHGTADRGQSTDDRDERDLASPFWQNNPVLVILLEFLTPPDPFEESNEEE